MQREKGLEALTFTAVLLQTINVYHCLNDRRPGLIIAEYT